MTASERLVADIGGTNARFARCGPDGEPQDERKLEVADYPGVVEAARAYLSGRPVADAVFAVAIHVDSDWIQLTNAPWAFSVRATRDALGLQRLKAVGAEGQRRAALGDTADPALEGLAELGSLGTQHGGDLPSNQVRPCCASAASLSWAIGSWAMISPLNTQTLTPHVPNVVKAVAVP